MKPMKKSLAIVACALLAGCASRMDPNDPRAPRELLPDPTFAKWFHLRGLGRPDDDGRDKGVFCTSTGIGAPVWTLAQWAARPSFADPTATRQLRLGDHLFAITNVSKRVTVDSRAGEIELGLFASACYDHPRRRGESWPHLLAETPLTDVRYPARLNHVADLERLDVSFACRLDAFADRQPGADPKLHAAQFQLFLYVQNLTRGDDGYGDMMWFGIPIFDNRYPLKEETYQRDGGKADASGKFIYSMASRECLADDKGFVRGGRLLADGDARWVSFSVDVRPWIERAYRLAREHGYFPATDWDDLYVGALNVGWEMPGSYDGVMRLRGLSLIATPKPPVPRSPSVPEPRSDSVGH